MTLTEQYNEMKRKHPDAILLFRVGDFYETFNDDAIICSDILGITLTRRTHRNSITVLAGFPHHALDTYLPKLVRAGKRVAICEQLEDPKLAKKIINRSESIKPQYKIIGCLALVNILSQLSFISQKALMYNDLLNAVGELHKASKQIQISPTRIFAMLNADYLEQLQMKLF